MADGEVPGFGVAVFRQAVNESQGEGVVVGEDAGVVVGGVSGQGAVGGGDAANPGGLARVGVRGGDAAEVYIERFGFVDVAGPEEVDVAVAEGWLAGGDFDGELDGAVAEEFIALAAFEGVVEGGLLAEFDGVAVHQAQFHGPVAGLELDIAVGAGCAVEDVFEIESGKCGDEEVLSAAFVAEEGDAAVAGAVAGENGVINGIVGDDYDFDGAAFQDGVGLFGAGEARGWVGERGAAGSLGARGGGEREERKGAWRPH